MKRFLVLPVFLLLVSGVFASITLGLFTSLGVQHNASNIEDTIGQPSVGTKYYFTSEGVSTNSANAFVVSQATESGVISFEGTASGDCSWYAIVGGSEVALNALDGKTVNSGDQVKWAVVPNSEAVVACQLVYDMNVISTVV